MNINCDIIRDLLPLYIDGTLSEASTELVRNHLRACHPCRLNYRQLKPVIKNALPAHLDSHAEYSDFLRRVRSRRITLQAATAAALTTLAVLTVVGWTQKRQKK